MLPVGPRDPRHSSADLPLKDALASARLACKQVGRLHQLPAQSIPRHAPVLGSRRSAAPQRQRSPGQDDRARLLPAQPLGAAIRGELSMHIPWVSAGRQTFYSPAYGHPRHAPLPQTHCSALGTAWPLGEWAATGHQGSFPPGAAITCRSLRKAFFPQACYAGESARLTSLAYNTERCSHSRRSRVKIQRGHAFLAALAQHISCH